MNAREIKLVVVALVVTAVAGGGYLFYLRGDAQGPAEAAKAKEAVVIPPAAKIRLEMMKDDIGGDELINIFNYRKEKLVATAEPEAAPAPIRIPDAPVVRAPIASNQTSNQPARPSEPAVTNVPLTYSGYARDDNDQMIAFLETNGTGAPAGHYNLREDDFLIGRFRVMKITADAVEVEDMDRIETSAQRKQTITLKK